ncbi:MAG: acyl-ACP desaturase [Mycobacteriales bacterium]
MTVTGVGELAELGATLEGAVEAGLARHLAVVRDWAPHSYVPWSEGQDFDAVPFAEEQSRLSPAVRAAVVVNLLTEDNLPAYHRELARVFGQDGAWETWTNRWTAEEGRHAIALRDYLTVTRAVDPDDLEAQRMATVQGGFRADEKDFLRTLAYVSLQERATRVAHRNTGLASAEPALDRLLARIATDENLHMVFYRDLVSQSLDLVPERMLEALAAEVASFTMPGTSVPGFTRKAVLIARAGIYNLRVHRDEVLVPLLRHWQVFERTGYGPRAQAAVDQLGDFLAALTARVERAERTR